jgi:hypothetical protein
MKKAHSGEGALIGAALGVTLAGIVSGKRKNVIISGLVGAAIGGTIGSQIRAKGNRVPYIVEDAGRLFKVYPDGSRRKIRF